MKIKRAFIIFLATLLISLTLASAQNTTCIYFFHGDGCQHCAKIEPLIDALSEEVEVHKFEIYNNQSNMLLITKLFESYNISVENRGIPAIFIGDTYLVGDTFKSGELNLMIEQNKNTGCPQISEQKNSLTSLSILTIIGAALVDSINPCAIAVLLILMGALLIAGDKKKALKAGFAFTASIYIAYFLFGIGLFSVIQISGLSYWFYKIIGILAIIIGLANVKDFFWYGGGGFVMEIPRNWRPKLKEMLSKVTSPLGAFLMGFVVCLFELPCTGGPYIVILGLLADKMTLFSSIPLLLLYNFVFIIPLIIITLLIYFGFANVENATKWKDNNLRILHLIAGIIMLALGILITLGLI